MKLVEQSAELLWITPSPEIAIERCGRIAYKSEDKITEGSAAKFVRMILERGHEAVIEHACASMIFITDRGITHEIVRHRLFSYVQESTRYCNYGKEKFDNEITVIKPIFPSNDWQYALHSMCWYGAMKMSEWTYMLMSKTKLPPQWARSVLPNSLKTEIAVTGNLREWKHFFKLRCAKTAHPQMQELAKMALRILSPMAPTVFEDLAKQYLEVPSVQEKAAS